MAFLHGLSEYEMQKIYRAGITVLGSVAFPKQSGEPVFVMEIPDEDFERAKNLKHGGKDRKRVKED